MEIKFDKIPWKKIGEGAAYAVAIGVAVVKAVDEHKKEMEFKEMKDLYLKLKGKDS